MVVVVVMVVHRMGERADLSDPGGVVLDEGGPGHLARTRPTKVNPPDSEPRHSEEGEGGEDVHEEGHVVLDGA